jgi:myo-inositol-1(or 4)-monophosphatase
MADVDFGFVHDFGAREEFAAERGRGATLNGHPITADHPGEGLEVVGLESADPRWILGTVDALRGEVYRLRVVGSLAISLVYVAAGRFDGALSARDCRSVDAAAAQLIVREAGGAVAFADGGLEAADLGLDARYTVAASLDPSHLGLLLKAQAAGSGPDE